MQHDKADPTPCERCRHRQDMHEMFAGVRMCRACHYVGLRWPCSPNRLREEAALNALTFTLDEPKTNSGGDGNGTQ